MYNYNIFELFSYSLCGIVRICLDQNSFQFQGCGWNLICGYFFFIFFIFVACMQLIKHFTVDLRVNSCYPTFHKYTQIELLCTKYKLFWEWYRICCTCIFIDKINVEWENRTYLHDASFVSKYMRTSLLLGITHETWQRANPLKAHLNTYIRSNKEAIELYHVHFPDWPSWCCLSFQCWFDL